MAYPILYKPEVCTGIEQVGGDRVLEGMEMPLALRDARVLAVVLHEFIQPAAADGRSVAGQEQRGGVAGALFEVGLKGFDFIGLEGVQAVEGAFEAVDVQPVLLQVEVGGGEVPDFGALRPWR
jgi:hypothetical protein